MISEDEIDIAVKEMTAIKEHASMGNMPASTVLRHMAMAAVNSVDQHRLAEKERRARYGD